MASANLESHRINSGEWKSWFTDLAGNLNILMNSRHWRVPFLQASRVLEGRNAHPLSGRWALIVLNQPFSRKLFDILWNACEWRVFADGGSNRVRDLLGNEWKSYLPDLITGDLDSIRSDVQQDYTSMDVRVVRDGSLDATDFMKCFDAIKELERRTPQEGDYSVIVLGGLSGRIDQTVHTMSYLYKLRRIRAHVFVATDDDVGWVLDEGEHYISLDRTFLGQTCGLLPVGIESTRLSMKGLQWNWTDHESSLDGDVSTSNWLAADEIWIKTTRPIWWTMSLK